MTEAITSVGDWARYGLAGMTIGALFVQAGWFLRAMGKKDEESRDFIREIIADDRKERREDRREHMEITTRLSSAINELTNELKKER